MRVLIFQDYFYIGGIEKIIMDIKNNLDKRYDIDILSMVNKSNNNIIRLLAKDYDNFFIRNIKGIFKFKKYIKNNKCDIIHINCYNSFGLIYGYIAYKYNKNIIIHGHNCNIDNDYLYIKRIINYIIKLLFRSNKYKYIAVNDETNKFCFNNNNNCIIIPNGIDYDKYRFNNKERIKYRKLFNIKDNEIVIGSVGRFTYQKNYSFIIDIFKEICNIKDNYRLILIGEGTLKKSIIDKVRKYGIENKVLFLSNRDDINKFINMFDIYLSPSVYEGFGLSIVENEINGKYVFVSDRVIKEVNISNRIKYISLNKDSKYWCNKIINKKDIKLVIDNGLDIKYFIKNIESVYQGVMNEKD